MKDKNMTIFAVLFDIGAGPVGFNLVAAAVYCALTGVAIVGIAETMARKF